MNPLGKDTGKSTWFRAFVVMAATAVVGIVLLLSLTLSQRINALKTAPEDNTQWVLARLEVDFLKLQNAVENNDLSTKSLEEFRLRYDVFFSRVVLMKEGRATRWLLEDPSDGAKIEKLSEFLAQTVETVDSSDEVLRSNFDQIRSGLAQIENEAASFALSAIRKNALRSDARRFEITRLLQSIAGALFVLFLALAAAIVILIRQKRRLNAKTSEVETGSARLASTLGASLDAIVVVRHDGQIIDFNGSAEQVFGINRLKAIGRNYFDTLVPRHLRDTYRRRFESSEGTENDLVSAGRFQIYALRADGREIPVEVSIATAAGEDGPIYITYMRDITEDLEKEDQLLVARDDALAAYKEKSKFLAVMSHEMRTPLNGIVSALDLMNDTPLTGDQRNFLKAAETSAEMLIGHVNDVLDIERIESGLSGDRIEPTDLSLLLPETLEAVRALADLQNTRLHLERRGDKADIVQIDARALQQVLLNLLSNAIKFTSNGDVTLELATSVLSPEHAQLTFHVRDTGQGIDKKDQQRIFEDFVTVDTTYERRSPGTGLGLGISRRLVETLGGQLTCESVLQKGSVFSFSTTVATGKEGSKSINPTGPDGSRELVSRNILLVEDNTLNRELLAQILVSLGQSVDEAADGFDGVQKASAKHYDLIFMDISMPHLNGVRATEMIRGSRGLSKNTPIYAVTAHALPDDKKRFARVGMAGTLTKPVRKAEIAEFLKNFSDAAPLGSQAPKDVKPDDSELHPLIDEKQFGDLRDIFKDAIGQKVEAFTTAINRDIEFLFDASNLTEVQKLAHEMAGAAATFGAARLHDKLAKIETACKAGQLDQARAFNDDLKTVWNDTQTAFQAI